MAWLKGSSSLVVGLLLVNLVQGLCPDGCVCVTTRDGLHRATCSNLAQLYKFTLKSKHHNINILNLSHNNITKVTHELDRLTEIVTLDLSTNGIVELNKFLHNAKKLVHLNLSNNRIRKLSVTSLPKSVSSLDLTNNLLKDVPSDLGHLGSLEHLQLEGNPIDCNCENIKDRDLLIKSKVTIDNVKCVSPEIYSGRHWLEIKTKNVCKVPKREINYLDIMMGDQPIDEADMALKSMPSENGGVLEDGNIIESGKPSDDDDSIQYMKASQMKSTVPPTDIEGSGDIESMNGAQKMPSKLTTENLHEGSGDFESSTVRDIIYEMSSVYAKDEVLPADNISTTEEPQEGSGEGSGDIFSEDNTTTPRILEELNPGPPRQFFKDDNEMSDNINTTEYPLPIVPSVFEGGANWHTDPPVTEKTIVKEKASTPLAPLTRDTTISEQIRVTQSSEVSEESMESKETTHKTGTYVCIAIIVVLLVGLIGFAIIKGQMRKRRDRRLLRQQKRDVEKASKEMVDMNKSLLGKPAPLDGPIDKKLNGKYELVPTHESSQKNGDVANGVKHNGTRTDSPRDSNQNKSSSVDNNLVEETRDPLHETSFDSDLASPDSRKDSHSLSSEDIFVPLNDDDTQRINGNADSDVSQPLINGNGSANSDYLVPPQEYVPVYSPDMGRVRIKMSETPKPKTPVLVTRSRSNAGDIIITPSLDANVRKSTT